MAKEKQTVEQLMIPDVVFSQGALTAIVKDRNNVLPAIADYTEQSQVIKDYMNSVFGPEIFTFYNSGRVNRNSGSKILKSLSKTSTFKRDSKGNLYVFTRFPIEEKNFTVVSVGRGAKKTLFPIPIVEEVVTQKLIHHNQDVLFFAPTNKTVKNNAVVANELLGIKEKTRKRKKKIDYSSNDVIINKKKKENLVDEIASDDVNLKANTKTTSVKVKPKLGFLDEINEDKEDN